jgi:hypothetical protein
MADSPEELQKQLEELLIKFKAAFPDKELRVFNKGVAAASDTVERVRKDLDNYRAGINAAGNDTKERAFQEKRYQAEIRKTIEEVRKSGGSFKEQQKALDELTDSIEKSVDSPALREAVKKQVSATIQNVDATNKSIANQKLFSESVTKVYGNMSSFANGAGTLVKDIFNASQNSKPLAAAQGMLKAETEALSKSLSGGGSLLKESTSGLLQSQNKWARGIGIAGQVVGTGLQGASKVAGVFTSALDTIGPVMQNWENNFSKASSAGALFGQGLDELRNTAGAAHMRMSDLVDGISQGMDSFHKVGLSFDQAAKLVGKTNGALVTGQAAQELYALGLVDVKDRVSAMAGAIDQARITGHKYSETQKDLAEITVKYSKDLKVLQAVVGKDAEKSLQKARLESQKGAVAQTLGGDENKIDAYTKISSTMDVFGDKANDMKEALNQVRLGGPVMNAAIATDPLLMQAIQQANKLIDQGDEESTEKFAAILANLQNQAKLESQNAATDASIKARGATFTKDSPYLQSANDFRNALITIAPGIRKAAESTASTVKDITNKGGQISPSTTQFGQLNAEANEAQVKLEQAATSETSVNMFIGSMKLAVESINNMIDEINALGVRFSKTGFESTLGEKALEIGKVVGEVALGIAGLAFGASSLGALGGAVKGAIGLITGAGSAVAGTAVAAETALVAGAAAVEGAAAISAGSMVAGAALIAAPVVAGVAAFKGLEVASEKIAEDPGFAKLQQRDQGKSDLDLRREAASTFAQRNNPNQDTTLSRAEIIKKYGLTGQQAVAQAMPGEDTWTLKDKSKLNTKTGERFDEQGNLLEIRGGPELTDALKELLKTNVDLRSTYLKLNDEGKTAAVEASKAGLDAASGFLDEQKRMAAEASKAAATAAATPVKATMTPTVDTTALEQGLKAQYTDANAAMIEMEAKQAAFIAQHGAPDVTLKPTMADFASDTVRKGYSDPELQKQAEEIQKSIYQFNSDQIEIQKQLRNVIAGLPSEFNKNSEFGTGRGGLRQDEAAVQALIDKFGYSKEALKQFGGGANTSNSLTIGEDSYSLRVVGLYKKLVDEELKKNAEEGRAAKAQVVTQPDKQGSAIPVDVLKQLTPEEKPEEKVESSFSPEELHKALLDSAVMPSNYLAGTQSPRQMRDALAPEDRPAAVKAMPSAQGTAIPPEILQKLGYDKNESNADILETITPIRDFANNIKGYMGFDGQKVMLDKLEEVVAVAKPNKEEPKPVPQQVSARAEATISPEKLALEQAAKSQFADAQATRKDLEAKQAALIAEHGKGDIQLPATALDYAADTRRTAYSDPEVQKQSEALKASIDQYSKDQLNAQLALANIIAGLPAEFNKGTLFATGDFENSSVQMQGAIKALIDEFGYTKEELKKFAGGARGGNRIQIGEDAYNPQVIGLYRKKVEEELKKSTTEQAAKIVTPESQIKDLVAPIIDMNRNADQTKSDQKAMLEKMDDVAAVATPTSASADAIQQSMAEISNSIKVAPNEPTTVMPDPLQMQKSTIEGLTEASTQRTAEQAEQQTRLLTAAAEMRNTMVEVANPDKPDITAVLAKQMGQMVALLEDLNDGIRNVSTNTRNTYQAVL